jgi:hypothetical protein
VVGKGSRSRPARRKTLNLQIERRVRNVEAGHTPPRRGPSAVPSPVASITLRRIAERPRPPNGVTDLKTLHPDQKTFHREKHCNIKGLGRPFIGVPCPAPLASVLPSLRGSGTGDRDRQARIAPANVLRLL